MITAAELQMLRGADPGAVLPGIDTRTGNLDATSSLINYKTISQSGSAPYFYIPTENCVVVTQNGAVLNGINFGTANVIIKANNVTIKNCSFSGTIAGPAGAEAIWQRAGYSGATVENCTFTGFPSTTNGPCFITSVNNIIIKNNSFIDTPWWDIYINAGTITGNYFTGAGFLAGAHSDAIYVSGATGPVSITNNFIDWTATPGALVAPNDAIRIDTIQGSDKNVTVSGNYLIGGSYTIDALDPGTSGNQGSAPLTNVSITNNYVGFGYYGDFFPGPHTQIAESGNVIFDFSNPATSTAAWAAYKTAGLPAGTLYGGGVAGATLNGSATAKTNFVGGFGSQKLIGGQGANIFTYLAISDSTAASPDAITNFDPAKDVIDLSHIDANLTSAGLQSFTFIGTAAFTGGAQVRYQQDPTKDLTYVEASLAGDTSHDLWLSLNGLQTLTASNFALTAAQSAADSANGAALSDSIHAAAPATSDTWVSYTNVRGKAYTSFEALYFWGPNRAADDLNISSTANELILNDQGLTVSRGSGAEAIVDGTLHTPVAYEANETIQISADGPESFVFGANFGNETINGFSASGTLTDTIQLSKSSFSYLTPAMTQAQDLLAVLNHGTISASGLTITDTHSDHLTLAGFGFGSDSNATTIAAPSSASTIAAAYPSLFHFT
jgi:Peptidase M10 serralysin C terminal